MLKFFYINFISEDHHGGDEEPSLPPPSTEHTDEDDDHDDDDDDHEEGKDGKNEEKPEDEQVGCFHNSWLVLEKLVALPMMSRCLYNDVPVPPLFMMQIHHLNTDNFLNG